MGPWPPARGVTGYEIFKDFRVDKIVDIFKPLTVNWLLARLANTLANTADGAESRR